MSDEWTDKRKGRRTRGQIGKNLHTPNTILLSFIIKITALFIVKERAYIGNMYVVRSFFLKIY